jgi:hypothetical protein
VARQLDQDKGTRLVSFAWPDRFQYPVEMPSQPVGQGAPAALVGAFQVDLKGLIQRGRALEKASQLGSNRLGKGQRF